MSLFFIELTSPRGKNSANTKPSTGPPMTEPAISMTRCGADVWRLTASRATYLPTELRRHELQRAERTVACKSQRPRFLRSPIRAANRLALWPRDRHRGLRNTSDHFLLRCLILRKTFNRISLRQLSFRRFRLL